MTIIPAVVDGVLPTDAAPEVSCLSSSVSAAEIHPVPLLFRVPQPWFVAFLSEWLDALSLGRIDIAISSSVFRPQFLKCLHEMRSKTVITIGKGYLKLKETIGFHISMDLGEWSGWWWQWLSRRQIYVESVELTAYNSIWVKAIDSNQVLEVPSLRQIKINSCSDDDLSYLIRVSPNIQSLNMSSSVSADELSTPDSNITWVSDIGLDCIAKGYQHSLETFSYERRVWCGYGPASEFSEGCVDYFMRTGRSLIDLLRQCSHLRQVNLTGDSLRAVDLNELSVFGHLFQELRFESYDETCLGPWVQSLTALLKKCINLKKLYYSGIGGLIMNERMILTAISQSCSLLENLELSSWPDPTIWDNTLPHLCQNLTRISKLVLKYCEFTDANLLSISGMGQLIDLQLHDSEGLTDLGISYLARLKLVNLEICEFDYQGDVELLSPSVLTAAAFQSFLTPGAAISQTLESFRMNIMNIHTLIDDVQVASAFATCHKLKHFHIHWGSQCEFGGQSSHIFSDSNIAFVSMLLGCPLLEEISLHMNIHSVDYLVGKHGCGNLKNATIGINSSTLAIFQEQKGTLFSKLHPHVKLVPFCYYVDGNYGTHEDHEMWQQQQEEDEENADEMPPPQEDNGGDINEEGNDNGLDVNAT